MLRIRYSYLAVMLLFLLSVASLSLVYGAGVIGAIAPQLFEKGQILGPHPSPLLGLLFFLVAFLFWSWVSYGWATSTHYRYLWGPRLWQTVQKLSERGVLEDKDLEDLEIRRIVSEQLKKKRPDLNISPDQILSLWRDPKFGPIVKDAIETPAPSETGEEGRRRVGSIGPQE